MLLAILLSGLAVVGHAALVVFLSNRLHATALPHGLLRTLSQLGHLSTVTMAALAVSFVARNGGDGSGGFFAAVPLPLLVYGSVCVVIALGPALSTALRNRLRRPPAELIGNRSRVVDMRDQKGMVWEGKSRLVVRAPFNESLLLEVNRKELRVPRLDPKLDGLRIAHLSDLHLTGRIGRPFFDEVVRITSNLECDLVAITGDIADKNPCLDWLPGTLGKLRARLGVYYVLGNHDVRVDRARMCKILDDAGLVPLSGRWARVESAGCPILLAGSAMPWIGPPPRPEEWPTEIDGRLPLRIVLSHTPDAISWAKTHEVDLVLAGHLHGGQIRLPLVGPVLGPSFHGTKYSSGVFFEPPTLLHVTRGLSAKLPLRFNCSPELTELVLRAAGVPPSGGVSESRP
jgi:hypothetical protein